jgi:hypothetical protein
MAVVGVAAGIMAVRTWRRRRSETTHVDTIHDGHEEPGTAAEHAAAATDHARIATKKAISKKDK